jgi:class 3 adenylate cyclase
MTTPPRTRYAQCGEIDLAYQVFGNGPHDLLVFAGNSIPIDSMDAQPAMARFQRRLASFCRIIRLDQRGIGMSAHVPAASAIGPTFWAEDALAVLDAVGSEQVTVFAPSFAALTGLVLAADYPDRIRGLVIFNGAARARWAPDYPPGVPDDIVAPFLGIAADPDAVEQGFDGLKIFAPSVADDDAFRAWWDQAGNRGATPTMARAVAAAIAQADVRDRLDKITMPTLILHRKDSVFVSVEHGRYLAEHMPGARYVELPGADTPYWVGETGQTLDEIQEFITGSRAGADADRVLATVLFTDIVGSTDQAARLGDNRWRDLLDNHDRIVRQQLGRFGGREVNTVGDGFVATFASPSRAIDCAHAIVDAVAPLGVQIRAGIHAGEMEIRGEDVAGMAVHIGARVAALAAASEVLVSSTLRDIVTGSARTFVDRGEHILKGVPGAWTLYAAERPR